MKRYIWIVLVCLILMGWTSTLSETKEAWVLCQPDSYVNIRTKPKSKSKILGRRECGEKVELDGKVKNGFAHCINLALEDTEGWISTGYLVYSEPKAENCATEITSKGRVACRRSVDGKRRCWVKNGTPITVHYSSAEWSVTDKGFIKTKYLILGDEE